MTSIFDPDNFLNEEQDELSTEKVLIPVGTHDAFIADLSTVSGTSDSGKDWAKLNVKWEITDSSVLSEMERDKVTITQGIMLDIDEATGKLATGKGKNWQLGQLRAAVGKPKGPLNDLIGASAKITIKYRTHEGKMFEDVKEVLAA